MTALPTRNISRAGSARQCMDNVLQPGNCVRDCRQCPNSAGSAPGVLGGALYRIPGESRGPPISHSESGEVGPGLRQDCGLGRLFGLGSGASREAKDARCRCRTDQDTSRSPAILPHFWTSIDCLGEPIREFEPEVESSEFNRLPNQSTGCWLQICCRIFRIFWAVQPGIASPRRGPFQDQVRSCRAERKLARVG